MASILNVFIAAAAIGAVLIILLAGDIIKPSKATDKLTVDNSSLNKSVEGICIGDIISEPRKYVGKKIVFNGKYGGWGQCQQALNGGLDYPLDLSQNAAVIFDETGCIYFEDVEFLSENLKLEPSKPMNESIKFYAKVKLDRVGTPYLGS